MSQWGQNFFLLNEREDFQAKLKPSFSVIKDDKTKNRAGVGDKVPTPNYGRSINPKGQLISKAIYRVQDSPKK